MDGDVIDFDQLQDEINEAERYLRQEVLRTKTQGFRHKDGNQQRKKLEGTDSDQRSAQTQEETHKKEDVQSQGGSRRVDRVTTPVKPDSFSTPKKYSNPESREKLLSRLLSEHGSKSKHLTPSMNTTAGASSVSQRDAVTASANLRYLVSSPAQSSGGVPTPETPENQSNISSNDASDASSELPGTNQEDILRAFHGVNDDTLFFASDVQEYESNWQNKGLEDSSIPENLSSNIRKQNVRSHSASPPAANSVNVTARPKSAGARRKHFEKPKGPNDSTKSGSQQKILKSKEEIISEAEGKFRQLHTFKPKLSSSNKSDSGNTRRDQNVDRIDSMIQVHNQALANREKQKIELERAKVELTCSFKPQLSKGTQMILKNKAKELGTDDTSAAERLYKQASEHEAQQRLLRRNVDEARNVHTFQPALNPKSRAKVDTSIEYRPLYERVGDVQREIAMNRQVLMECYEEAQSADLTHNPSINERSRKLLEKKRQNGDTTIDTAPEKRDVGSRLMEEAKKQMNRKYDLMDKREKELALGMRRPEVCKGSQKLVANNPNISKSDFIKRQEDHAKKKVENMSESRRKGEIESSRWFKPDVNVETNRILSENRPDLINETPEERTRRLYRDDVEEAERKRQQIEEEMYGNISFVPKIDSISRELGRKNGIRELSENRRGNYARIKAKQRYEKRESEECTFQPQIARSQKSYRKEMRLSGKSSGGPSLFAPHMAWEDVGCPLNHEAQSAESGKVAGKINLREPERMAKEIRLHQLEKDEKRRAALIVREVDELQECTFQPKIYRRPNIKNCNPVVVNGIGRHFELRHMKQKQDEAIRERQKNAFRVKNADAYRRKCDGSTIVQPFNIAQPCRRKSRAAVELENLENSNLTFHPVTNDIERRLKAKSLMAMSSQLESVC